MKKTVPWERMQRRAGEEGIPLVANTLAKASGCAIDHLGVPPTRWLCSNEPSTNSIVG